MLMWTRSRFDNQCDSVQSPLRQHLRKAQQLLQSWRTTRISSSIGYYRRLYITSYCLCLWLDSTMASPHASSPFSDGPTWIYTFIHLHTTDDVCCWCFWKILGLSHGRSHRYEVPDGDISSTCSRTFGRTIRLRLRIDHHSRCKPLFITNSSSGLEVRIKMATKFKIHQRWVRKVLSLRVVYLHTVLQHPGLLQHDLTYVHKASRCSKSKHTDLIAVRYDVWYNELYQL